MITDVEVEDFQAIRKASIKLGRFTVVTGPTGSGKSGLIRAMRLVAFNARGTSYIRHGAKKCAALLGFQGDGYVVAIHRGGRGQDKYVVGETVSELDVGFKHRPKLHEYTKLEGKVPADVSQLLGLGEINFAGQFDRPYLLTESGSQVARVLGELTNVTLVFDAAREANRRKLETARDLRAAEELLRDLTEQAKGFRSLKARIEAGADARAAVGRMTELGERYGRLRNLAETHRALEHQWAAAQHRKELASVPSTEHLEQLHRQLWRLRELAGGWAVAREDVLGQQGDAARAVSDEAAADQELTELLVEAGTCPTCGQPVSALWT